MSKTSSASFRVQRLGKSAVDAVIVCLACNVPAQAAGVSGMLVDGGFQMLFRHHQSLSSSFDVYCPKLDLMLVARLLVGIG